MSTPAESALEAALFDLAGAVDYPPVPDVTAIVRRRMGAATPAGRTSWFDGLIDHFRRPAFALTLAGVLACVALIGSTGARRAVADWLGFDEVRIQFRPSPVRTPTEMGGHLSFGDPATLEAARARSGLRVEIPGLLGDPDEVYVAQLPGGVQVALLYEARPGDREITTTGLGHIVTQFETDVPGRGYFLKFAPPEGQVREVEVAGARGLWLTGEHIIAYRTTTGEFYDESLRLVANALIFKRDSVVYRVETLGTRAEAIQIAESMF